MTIEHKDVDDGGLVSFQIRPISCFMILKRLSVMFNFLFKTRLTIRAQIPLCSQLNLASFAFWQERARDPPQSADEPAAAALRPINLLSGPSSLSRLTFLIQIPET